MRTNCVQSESSATIVWSELANYTSLPLIWNIFPFHPHEKNNPQSNRRPNKAELELGKAFVVDLIKMFEIQKIITLGRSAESKVSDLGIQYHYVRHPSFGGKQEFIKGFKRVMVK